MQGGLAALLDAQDDIEVVGAPPTAASRWRRHSAELFLSEATVKHLTGILSKLGLRDRVQGGGAHLRERLVEPGARA